MFPGLLRVAIYHHGDIEHADLPFAGEQLAEFFVTIE
jgi:hypothetical protein